MSVAKKVKKSHPDVVDLTQEDSVIVNDGRDKNLVVITLDDSDEISIETIKEVTPASQHVRPTKSSTTSTLLSTQHTPRSTSKRPIRPETPPNTPKCPICIETFANVKKRGLKIVTTKCGHIFCDFCLKRAMSENGRTCPKCRKNVPRGANGVIEIFDMC